MHSLHMITERADEVRFEVADVLLALARSLAGATAARAEAVERWLRTLAARSREPARVPAALRPAAAALWGTSALVLGAVDMDVALLHGAAAHLDRRLGVALHERRHAHP